MMRSSIEHHHSPAHSIEQKAEILETIKKLSTVADNNSNETLIPLSQVGFCWGRYSSEGCIMETPADDKDCNADITRVSCTDALDIMNERLKRIEGEIEAPYCKTDNAPVKQKFPRHPLNTGDIDVEDKASSYADPNANVGNDSKSSEVKMIVNDKTGSETDQKRNHIPRDVFEIREYVDDSGATLKHELLNVSKGRDIIEKIHENAEAANQSSSPPSTTKSIAGSSDHSNQTTVSFDNEDAASSFSFDSEEESFEDMMNDLDDQKLDEDSRFIREIGLLSDHKGHLIASERRPNRVAPLSSSYEMLNEMNKKQQSSQQQTALAAQTEKKGITKSVGSGGFGGGWKAGFLSDKKTSKKTTKPGKVAMGNSQTEVKEGSETGMRVRLSDNIPDSNISSYSKSNSNNNNSSDGKSNSSFNYDGGCSSFLRVNTSAIEESPRVSQLPLRKGAMVSLPPVPSSSAPSNSIAFTGNIVERFHT